jgi:hypothetical protein
MLLLFNQRVSFVGDLTIGNQNEFKQFDFSLAALSLMALVKSA